MSLHQHSPLAPFLDKLERRASFSAAERRAILNLPFTPVHIDAHCDFQRRGERLTSSCFVLAGMVGAFKQDRNGLRQIVALYLEGDMADLHSVALPEALVTLTAIHSTTVLQVPHEELRFLAKEYPCIAEAMWRESVVDASILMEWVYNVGHRLAKARMAHLLCELCYRSLRSEPPDNSLVPCPITQAHLSEIVGLTPVHVNRVLQELRKDGLIATVERSRQRILNWKALAQVAGFDPSYLQLDRGALPASPVSTASENAIAQSS